MLFDGLKTNYDCIEFIIHKKFTVSAKLLKYFAISLTATKQTKIFFVTLAALLGTIIISQIPCVFIFMGNSYDDHSYAHALCCHCFELLLFLLLFLAVFVCVDL